MSILILYTLSFYGYAGRMKTTYAIEVKNVSQNFGDVVALKDVTITAVKKSISISYYRVFWHRLLCLGQYRQA